MLVSVHEHMVLIEHIHWKAFIQNLLTSCQYLPFCMLLTEQFNCFQLKFRWRLFSCTVKWFLVYFLINGGLFTPASPEHVKGVLY